MRNRRLRTVTAIVSIALFVVTMGLAIFMNNVDKHKEETTVNYVATVQSVSINDSGKRVFAKIAVEEYSTFLLVSTNICQHIDVDHIRYLEKGQTVYFGVAKEKTEQINNVEFVDIVSLQTETKSLFSVEDYDRYMRLAVRPARGVCIIMAAVFLSISMVCLLKKKHSSAGDGSVCPEKDP